MPISKVMIIFEKYLNANEITKYINNFENNFPDLKIVQYHNNVFFNW